MNLKSHINNVLDHFYTITSVPIQAFHFDGHFINSFGYNRQYSDLFNKNNIFEDIKSKLISTGNTSVSMEKDRIFFTATPFCPKNIYRGIFIIGPYGSSKDLALANKPLSTSKYMTSLVRIIWKDSPEKDSFPISESKPYSIHTKRAIDYIESRYMDDISLDDISKYLNISKPYFCSLFKKETKATFTHFLNKTRIEKSKELLLDHSQSMLDVALSVGYNNQNYYNIIFKKFTKLTPLEYRNNHS